MRRLLALLLVASASFVASGCSGVDAQKAQGILDQSTTAMADVKSVSFAMRMWTSDAPGGDDLTMVIKGGGYQKGKRAGDAYAILSSSGDGIGSMTVVVHDGLVYVKAGGNWASVPVPADQAAANPLVGFDLTRYVKDVRVEEGLTVSDEPMDKITGVIDTAAAVEGLLALGGTRAPGLGEAKNFLGDIRAVLYVSETTHLPMRTLVDTPIDVLGQKIVFHVDLVLTGVNEPVAIPSVG